MKTPCAHTWKSFTSKLHAPLPLSPRDSQKLLALLNASFKQQLDRQHSADLSSNEHHANLHLQSILTNPLFDAKPRTHAFSTNKSQCSGRDLGQLQHHIERPMDAFKEQVSQGRADIGTAYSHLSAQYKSCLASPAATVREAMQSSGAASTIVQWLWSSGKEDTGEFLRNQTFVSLLVHFLVAEGQQSRVLRWLCRCNNIEKTPVSSLQGFDTYRITFPLFASLIKAETKHYGLESTIALFNRTIADLQSSESTKSSVNALAIQGAWTLVKLVLRPPKVAELDYSIFRPFLATMRQFQADPLLNATLCIYLQERPSPQPALRHFLNMSAQAIVNANTWRRPHMVLLGLRAAELFFQGGHQTEAFWIMDFLQKNFAQELGSPPPLPQIRTFFTGRPRKKLKGEETSLHLLDELAVQ